MGPSEVETFLSHPESGPQRPAVPLPRGAERGPGDYAKKPKRLPTILAKEEVHRVLGKLSGTHQRMAKLLYGSGLRLKEYLRLREQDLARGHGEVYLPDALARKYPNAAWLCAAHRISRPVDPDAASRCRATMHFQSKTCRLTTAWKHHRPVGFSRTREASS